MSNRIEPKIYKGRGVKETVQHGRNENTGTDQTVVELFIPELERSVSTILYWSEKAAPFAIERLRALGWDNDDPTNMSGIDQNEVDVRIFYETYEGTERMKAEIVTGGGRIVIQEFGDADKRAFKARVQAMMGKKPDTSMPGTSFPMGANAPSQKSGF